MVTDEGIKYRVRHERIKTPSSVLAKGGTTVVAIYSEGHDVDRLLAVGSAICRPDENYNRRLGRTIALGRALKKFRMKPCEFVQIDDHEWDCRSHDCRLNVEDACTSALVLVAGAVTEAALPVFCSRSARLEVIFCSAVISLHSVEVVATEEDE